jgi:hypothetical protein
VPISGGEFGSDANAEVLIGRAEIALGGAAAGGCAAIGY